MAKRYPWYEVPDDAAEIFTPEQRKIFPDLKAGIPMKDIAKKHGVSENGVAHMRDRMVRRLERHDCSPTTEFQLHSMPPYQAHAKTVHTKRNPDTGEMELAQVWWKPRVQNDQAAIEAAVEELCSGIKPFNRVAAPRRVDQDLCTVYTLTDFHLGMYAWGEETGADWDMEIAKAVMLNAFIEMMDGSPDSEVGVFANIGDLLHWDGMLAVTPTAKNVLDADTRFELLVATAIEVCEQCIELLLHKHKRVHVIHAEGNHDQASSVWLRSIARRVFAGNPRVTVETSPFPFYHFQWGKVFLAWHHGHLVKLEKLPVLFATDPKFRKVHGDCEYTYIHTGHFHERKVLEIGGAHVEQHPTLAARDAYAARQFLMTHRSAAAITYHRDEGEDSRKIVRPKVK